MKILYAVLILLLAACVPSLVPATEPPQLRHTPGLFITFDGEFYDAQVFRVRVPDGWRVIKTSTAASPMQVVFAAPQGDLSITISAAPLDPVTPEAEQIVLQEERGSPARPVIVRAQGPAEAREALERAYQHVLDTLEIPVPSAN